MNASELAAKMLEWEKRKVELDALTTEIEAAVLDIGKTQVVGKVRATYSGGRATYDYQTPCAEVSPDVLARFASEQRTTDWDAVADFAPDVVQRFTTINTVYDYRAVCKEAKIDPVVISKTAPTVTVKLEA